MAGFWNSIRGDGLFKLDIALAALREDPQALDRARARFNKSPSPYDSDQPGSTRFDSPTSLSEEDERRRQLEIERDASLPDHQLEHQIHDEKERIFKQDINKTSCIRVGDKISDVAYKNVKKRWDEQGIWNKKWDEFACGFWKHEEALEDSESETDTAAEYSSPSFFGPKKLRPLSPQDSRTQKSDEEKRVRAERRVVRQREREASRPYYQFVYQISTERGRIQEDMDESEQGAGAADINTMAYEKVKNTWTKRGLWNKRWGILPGMLWKHEQPILEEDINNPAPISANSPVPDLYIPGDIGGLSPPELVDDRLAPAILDTSQQGLCANLDLAGLQNDKVQLPPPGTIYARYGANQWILCPKSMLEKRDPTHTDGQLASASPSLVHEPKLSNAIAKEEHKLLPQLNASQEVTSDSVTSTSANAADQLPSPPPDRATPRRSERLQLPLSSVETDSAETAPTKLLKKRVSFKLEQESANTSRIKSSKKPQGVSKRQCTRTTRTNWGKAGRR